MQLPVISLIGRTNVGKSAIFNRLTRRKVKNIVFDQENVTRDYIEDVIQVDGKAFKIVDTGGISIKRPTDELEAKVYQKVLDSIKKSKIIFFVCDIKVGLTDQDIKLAKKIRSFGVEVFLILNKADNKDLELESFDFVKLGFEKVFLTSAVHSLGFKKLLKEVFKTLEEPEEENKNIKNRPELRVSIVGKPNVGKSSILNMLVGLERSIVSDIEGTTREAISINSFINHQMVELVDTAGVRRKRSVNDSLEKVMVKSSLEAVRISDLIIIVCDGSQGSLCKQELKLIDYAKEKNKAVILVLNKLDLFSETSKVNLEYNFEKYDFILKKIPIVKTSCLTKKGLGKLRNHIEELWSRKNTEFDTIKVTDLIKNYLNHKPLYKQGNILKIFKVRALKARVPTFHLYVKEPKLWDPQELSCIENVIRKEYDLKGCPVVLGTRKI